MILSSNLLLLCPHASSGSPSRTSSATFVSFGRMVCSHSSICLSLSLSLFCNNPSHSVQILTDNSCSEMFSNAALLILLHVSRLPQLLVVVCWFMWRWLHFLNSQQQICFCWFLRCVFGGVVTLGLGVHTMLSVLALLFLVLLASLLHCLCHAACSSLGSSHDPF